MSVQVAYYGTVYTYGLDISPGVDAVNLSTIASATLSVLKSDGTIATWTGVLSNQGSTTLTVSYTTVGGATPDLSTVGLWVVTALLVVTGTGQIIPCVPQQLIVKSIWDPS